MKSAVLDLSQGTVVGLRQSKFLGFTGWGGRGVREVDPLAVLSVARECIAARLAEGVDPVGLVVCSQMHSTLLSSEDGKPLTTCVTWQDHRSLYDGSWASLKRLCTSETAWELGNELNPGYPATVLHSLVARDPKNFAGALVLNLADWLIWQLSGEVPLIHPTQASATGLWSVRDSDWHHKWISTLGLGALTFPEVGESSTARRCNFDGVQLRVLPSIGDQQAGLLGVGLGSGQLSLNVGTGSQVSTLLTSIPSAPSTNFQVRPFFGGRYLATVTHLPAGRAMGAWMGALSAIARAHGISEGECWATALREAEGIDVDDLPDVNLALFPCRLGNQGGIDGLTERTLTAGHLVRGAIRSMAYNYVEAARMLPGSPFGAIVMSGGLADRVRLLRDDVEGLFGVRPTVAGDESDTMRGLLVVARSFEGHLDVANS